MNNYENILSLKNGIQLSYIKKGEGSAVLLLHGNRDSKQNFNDLIEDLATDHTVYAVDLRGHGRSDKPKLGYEFEKFVEDIKEFVDVLQLECYSIIGHSLGASIAMQIAIDDSEHKIEKMVLIGTSAKFTPSFRPNMIKKENIEKTELASNTIQEVIHNALRPYFIVEEYKCIEPLVFSNWSNMSPEIHQALVMQLKHPDLLEQLPKIKQKVLVVAGSEDKVTPMEQCKQVSELIPDARFEVVEGCGHFVYLEEEKRVYNLIYDFLDGGVKDEKTAKCSMSY